MHVYLLGLPDIPEHKPLFITSFISLSPANVALGRLISLLSTQKLELSTAEAVL